MRAIYFETRTSATSTTRALVSRAVSCCSNPESSAISYDQFAVIESVDKLRTPSITWPVGRALAPNCRLYLAAEWSHADRLPHRSTSGHIASGESTGKERHVTRHNGVQKAEKDSLFSAQKSHSLPVS